jgi:hypothetical protein
MKRELLMALWSTIWRYCAECNWLYSSHWKTDATLTVNLSPPFGMLRLKTGLSCGFLSNGLCGKSA